MNHWYLLCVLMLLGGVPGAVARTSDPLGGDARPGADSETVKVWLNDRLYVIASTTVVTFGAEDLMLAWARREPHGTSVQHGDFLILERPGFRSVDRVGVSAITLELQEGPSKSPEPWQPLFSAFKPGDDHIAEPCSKAGFALLELALEGTTEILARDAVAHCLAVLQAERLLGALERGLDPFELETVCAGVIVPRLPELEADDPSNLALGPLGLLANLLVARDELGIDEAVTLPVYRDPVTGNRLAQARGFVALWDDDDVLGGWHTAHELDVEGLQGVVRQTLSRKGALRSLNVTFPLRSWVLSECEPTSAAEDVLPLGTTREFDTSAPD